MSKLSVAQVNAKIKSHEAVCAERWLEIINRVKRVEHFIVATLITLVLGMAGIIFGS
jgi:predicted nucleic acid-binding Zn ribbon protein